MAFIQYLIFNEELLPFPDSYEITLSDVEADSSGETEAGTNLVKRLTIYSKLPKNAVRY